MAITTEASAMINCPDFDMEPDNGLIVWIYHPLSVLSIITHVYTMYCIVCQSPAQMKGYRWHLLWHQMASCFGDLWINLIVVQGVFYPFPLGYLRGLGAGFVSTKMALAAGEFFVVLTMSASIQLLLYRYLSVSTSNVKFPLWSKLILAYNYMIPFVDFIATMTADDSLENTKRVLQEWGQTYTCVTPSLLSIPGIVAFDRVEFSIKTFSFEFAGGVNYSIIAIYFVRATFSAINTKILSEQRRRIQRKFLIQLLLQAGIPIIIIIVPIFMVIWVVAFDIFGIPYFNDYVCISLSLFGLSGGLVLIVMVPRYHWWLRKPKFLARQCATRTIRPVSNHSTRSSRPD